MATVSNTVPVPAPPAPPVPHRRSSRIFRPWRLLACVVLAVIVTAGVSAGSALWVPFVRPTARFAMPGGGGQFTTSMSLTGSSGLRQRIDAWTAEHESVEVATWGDHLKPWHIRIVNPFATRVSWFEKGRVYSRGDVKAPPGASSAAVSSWSFATTCWTAVGSKLTGPLPTPPELTESNEQGRSWATAIEERGWPFRAFTCRILAPMGATEAAVYTVEGGVWAEGEDIVPSGAIQELRVIPTTPIWSGIIANTAVFTVALYLLSFMPGVVFRRFRVKRGHCPRCRYDLRDTGGESAGCPECGWNRQPARAPIPPPAPDAAPAPPAPPPDNPPPPPPI